MLALYVLKGNSNILQCWKHCFATRASPVETVRFTLLQTLIEVHTNLSTTQTIVQFASCTCYFFLYIIITLLTYKWWYVSLIRALSRPFVFHFGTRNSNHLSLYFILHWSFFVDIVLVLKILLILLIWCGNPHTDLRLYSHTVNFLQFKLLLLLEGRQQFHYIYIIYTSSPYFLKLILVYVGAVKTS